MKRIFAVVLAVLVCIPLVAEARLGGAGAQFLVLGGGCRSVALGGAYVALAEGADAIYYNPAGLAVLDASTVFFSHGELFADMVGISGVAHLSGDIKRTTFEDQESSLGETFSANDFALGLSFARMMTDKFTAGLTFKFINQNIDKVNASSWAFDVGGTYSPRAGNMKLGFAIRNFGPDLVYSGDGLGLTIGMPDYSLVDEDIPATYKSEPYPMPLIFQMGLTYNIVSAGSNRLIAAVDGLHLSDQDETFNAGLEYGFNDSYFARIGYTGRQQMGLTAGLGARVTLTSGILASIDYSYEDHEYMDGIQRFSLTVC